MRAIHKEFVELQRQRDKADQMQSKQLATYDPEKRRKKGATSEWKETRAVEKLRAEAKVRQVVGHPTDGAGIGFGYRHKRRACDGPKAEREELLRVFKVICEEER